MLKHRHVMLVTSLLGDVIAKCVWLHPPRTDHSLLCLGEGKAWQPYLTPLSSFYPSFAFYQEICLLLIPQLLQPCFSSLPTFQMGLFFISILSDSPVQASPQWLSLPPQMCLAPLSQRFRLTVSHGDLLSNHTFRSLPLNFPSSSGPLCFLSPIFSPPASLYLGKLFMQPQQGRHWQGTKSLLNWFLLGIFAVYIVICFIACIAFLINSCLSFCLSHCSQ